jgi:flagellar protein FlaF
MQKQINKLYRQTQMDSAPAGRQIEVSILELASAKMRAHLGEGAELNWSRELDESLKFNQKVWDVFSADWMGSNCKLEQSLRENLLSIAIFVKKKTFTTMANPHRADLELLIQINENILVGLKAGMESQHPQPAETD